MKTYAKFTILVVAIIGVLAMLASSGISESKTYYKTISELNKMGDQATGKRVRVGGDVEPGSITRNGREVSFVLHQDSMRLKVVYSGMDPLPDTFKGGAQALADGRLSPTGCSRRARFKRSALRSTKRSPCRTRTPSRTQERKICSR